MKVPRSIRKFVVACNDDVHGLDREEVKEVSLAMLVDITESKRYSPPSDASATVAALANKTAATLAQWWQCKAKANRHLNSSSVVAYNHMWVSTLTFTREGGVQQPEEGSIVVVILNEPFILLKKSLDLNTLSQLY
ncbi:hypothetical protein M405DRAFT_841436 [Rhizopogon salebrosus TDB-379]|nr:hypothetical protein M405DRAFT_841436 [Rhizopogon salebrosus TDB-379]